MTESTCDALKASTAIETDGLSLSIPVCKEVKSIAESIAKNNNLFNNAPSS